MEKYTRAQFQQIKEYEMMKKGVSPSFFARPERDVSNFHEKAIKSILNSSICQGKETKREDSPEFVSQNTLPEHHSKITLLFVNQKIFIVHTEGTCYTHTMREKLSDYEYEDVHLEAPRTIIIDISGDLSDQELYCEVQKHELVNPAVPRSEYHIEVCISSGNRSQTLTVLMNTDKTHEDDTLDDETFRRNIVIEKTRILLPLSDDDEGHVVFHAVLLDNEKTAVAEYEQTGEVVGSIHFGAVLTA